MSGTIDNLGLSPRLPNVSSGMLEKQLQNSKLTNKQMRRDDNESRMEHVKLMNRLVRAEALAASLEKQIYLAMNLARSNDNQSNKKNSVTSVMNDFIVDYTYKPDIDVSDKIRNALAQSLLVNADVHANSSNLNRQNLRRVAERKSNDRPEFISVADKFNLRETRNNMLMMIGPKSPIQHKGRNGRGRTYKEVTSHESGNTNIPLPPTQKQKQNAVNILPTKIF